MSENNEIEAKILLSQQTYQALCADFKAKSSFNQTNYYFDTNNGLLQKNKISCRIRLFDDRAEQTLKVPHENPIQEKYHEATEINDALTLDEAKDLLASATKKQQVVFTGSVGIFIKQHFNCDCAFYLQTFSQTHRILANGPQDCELTFDDNHYPDQYEDFELEIENSDPHLIKNVLAKLKEKYHIVQTSANTNQAKTARAFSHRDRI